MKRFTAILMTLIMVLGLSSVWVWADDEATWQEETTMPKLRSCKALAAGNKIYIVGGMEGSSFLREVDVYDPQTKTWSTVAPMTISRVGFGTAIIDDKIYLIGGKCSTASIKELEIYDTKTDSWSIGPSMSTQKYDFASAAVGNKIYAIGGWDGESLSSTVEVYDTETNTWTAGTSMPLARRSFTSSVVDGKIYVIGGTGTQTLYDTVDIYNPENDTWTTGEPMPTAKYSFTSSVIDGKIYVIGGRDSSKGYLDSVDIYDPVKDSWSTGPSLSIARRLLNSGVIGDTIYAIGGFSGDGQLTNLIESLKVGTAEEPNPLLDLTATGGNSVVDLSWGAVSGADSYTVKRSLTEGGPYTVIADGVTDTTYSDTDVVNGTTYYYVVTTVSAGGESENSNEASATPQASTSSGKALLVITMTNGLEKEYDLEMSEVNNFIDWYDSKAAGNGQGYYTISKTFNLGPFMTRTDYLTFDKIQNFEVMQYN